MVLEHVAYPKGSGFLSDNSFIDNSALFVSYLHLEFLLTRLYSTHLRIAVDGSVSPSDVYWSRSVVCSPRAYFATLRQLHLFAFLAQQQVLAR